MSIHKVGRLLSLLTILLFAQSCMTTKIKQHNLPCYQRTQVEIIRSATSILVMNGFRITLADTLMGLVQAETEEAHDVWSGRDNKRVWTISIKSSLDQEIMTTAGEQRTLESGQNSKPLYIVALAKVVSRSRNVYGATASASEDYYDNDSPKDWGWYWDVRKGLETICGATSVITVKEMKQQY